MTATALPILVLPVLPEIAQLPTPPDTVCVCGGLLINVATTRVNLTRTAVRRLHRVITLVEHVEACEDCLDGGDPRECRERHRTCDAPEAAQCSHGQCREDARPPTLPACAHARDLCCGCCWTLIYGED